MNPPDPRTDRAGNWSRYWASGALHSCAGSFAGNYDGAVRTFWQAALAGLAADACVLDLCTGNGALPQLVVGLLPERADVHVHAVDIAGVAPSWLAGMPAATRSRLHFHPHTSVERLPLADASVDLAISQFGVEYTDIDRCAAELRRVLKPGARAAFIVHARESLISHHARADLAHGQWLHDQAVFERAAQMCAPMSELARPGGRERLRADAAANALRARFNEVMQAVAERASREPEPALLQQVVQDISVVMNGCATHGDAARGRAELERRADQHRDHLGRLHELVAAALPEAGLEAFAARFGLVGVEQMPIRFDGGALLGWGLRGRFSGT